MINLDDELAAEYLAESCDPLDTVEKDLLAIEKRGAEIDVETVNRVYRSVHSVKGGAGFFDLLKISELAHQTEDVVALMRCRKMVPTPERVRVLLRATDKLRELIRSAGTSNQADIAELMAALAGLPAGHPASDGKSGDSASQQARPSEEPLRVLLVEDDFASRLLLQTFLSRYGECHIAVTGKEAVEAFSSALELGQGYDLICMDIMMREMDGREAVQKVRALEESKGISSTYGVKIIMTTAVTDIKEVIRCFLELCDAYLMKPIDLAELKRHMKSFELVR